MASPLTTHSAEPSVATPIGPSATATARVPGGGETDGAALGVDATVVGAVLLLPGAVDPD
ncbi:MAG: hypothetical protein IPH03_03750 [Tetrasphaera sp.]|nr:hypothetical protein [Tetrasphaera sp.]